MHRYQPRSPLQAIDPKAFFSLFAAVDNPENEERDDAVIVTIRGPLTQHSSWWEDSYEAIRARVAEACEKSPPVVVLCIDSPGGDVHGLFDTVRAIRAMCDDAGKRLLAHIEGQGCSAAYALATAAERIMASRTAEVGSIGVVAARVDETKLLDDIGIRISLVTSGDRKGDGWSCASMSKDELKALQADVDGLAAEFFDVVYLSRGIPIEKIAALEAASFRGDAALNGGLVDELGSLNHLLASLGAATQGTEMDEEEKAREALRSIAEDEERDEEERARARRALAALDDEEEEAQDEDDEEEAEDEEDKDKAAASSRTVSAATAGAVATHGNDVEQRLAALESAREAEQIEGMIAAHGGVSAGLAKVLASKPLADVKELLAQIPKPRKPKLGDAAKTGVLAGERGDGEGRASRLSPREAQALDQAMGLDVPKLGVVKRKGVLEFGARLDEGGE